jgi:hypothetical protein
MLVLTPSLDWCLDPIEPTETKHKLGTSKEALSGR